MNHPLNSTQLGTVLNALRGGDRIGAVKLYREYTGTGLAEAKQAVDQLESANPPDKSFSTSTGGHQMLPERMNWIHEALFRGEKIEAIKLFRDGTNRGLKESKEAVEQMEKELRTTQPEKFSKPPAKGCLGMLMAAGLLLLSMIMIVAISLR